MSDTFSGVKSSTSGTKAPADNIPSTVVALAASTACLVTCSAITGPDNLLISVTLAIASSDNSPIIGATLGILVTN